MQKVRCLPLEQRMKLYNQAKKFRKENEWGQRKISKEIKVSESTIAHWIYKEKGPNPRRWNPTKELLNTLYWIERLTARKIARLFGVSFQTVLYEMKRLGVPRREWRVLPNLEPSEDLAYVVGVILGDGYANNVGTNYRVMLNVRSVEFANSFSSALARLGFRPKVYRILGKKGRYSNKEFYVCQANSAKFVRWFRRSSLADIEKRILLTNQFKIKFLKGIYESEGSLSWRPNLRNYHIYISNTDYELICLVKNLLNELGFSPTIPNPSKFPNRKDLYTCRLNRKSEIKQFLNQINPSIKNGKGVVI